VGVRSFLEFPVRRRFFVAPWYMDVKDFRALVGTATQTEPEDVVITARGRVMHDGFPLLDYIVNPDMELVATRKVRGDGEESKENKESKKTDKKSRETEVIKEADAAEKTKGGEKGEGKDHP